MIRGDMVSASMEALERDLKETHIYMLNDQSRKKIKAGEWERFIRGTNNRRFSVCRSFKNNNKAD